MSGSFLPTTEWPFLIIRGQRVLVHTDLARIFGQPVDEIEKRVRRNRSRFPQDFLFRLTRAEKDELVAKCRRLRRLKLSRSRPLAFTETGVLMLAGLLEGPGAEVLSTEIIRAFIHLRKVAATDRDLTQELAAIESRYDAKFKKVFDAIRELMEPPPNPPRPRIGFQA